MSIAEDLLEQAEHLASRERKRPKQASLRRAVSAAYYALFHLLVDEAASTLVTDRNLRLLVARAFEHGHMKHAASSFASAALPQNLAAIAGRKIPKDLQEVAATFIDLQEARHEADYNFAERFTRTEVQRHIHRARRAFAAWTRVKGQKIARVFLAALLLARRWDR
ncbi:MAG TPA: hypothetical protein VKH44_04430 [Pirellulaceae bacterium]|nr:hypothetical protein [Pirellulaceae bacterium]